MNANITSFFVVNKNNKTVAFGSNLKECHDMFSKIEPLAKNYQYYYRRFQKEPEFNWENYLFQQIV